MMANNVSQAVVMVLTVIFNLYIMALMARVLLQLTRASPFNPFTRTIINITKPCVSPLQRIMPTVRNVDLAAIFVTFLFTLGKIYAIAGAGHGVLLSNFAGAMVWAIGDMLSILMNLFFYAIIIQIIASWVAAGQQNPGIEVIYHITNPILRPFQRLIPALGGLDLSPIFAILLIKASEVIVIWPLINVGRALAIN